MLLCLRLLIGWITYAAEDQPIRSPKLGGPWTVSSSGVNSYNDSDWLLVGYQFSLMEHDIMKAITRRMEANFYMMNIIIRITLDIG